MKNKFLLFAGDDYYPEGGAYDFKGGFGTIEEAIESHNPSNYKYDGGWANIFDTINLKVVKWFVRGIWYDGERKDSY